MSTALEVEVVSIESLRPHPMNYQTHPPDQIAHLIESITEHGLYRNVVVARDGTILAGHGVTQALREMGRTEVPVVRLQIEPDDPRALKVLAGDNEISHLSEKDDRALTEILKIIKETEGLSLTGTGFDEMMLANLVMVSRPASEIEDFDEAAEWVGMPEYDPTTPTLKVIVSFESETDRQNFAKLTGVQLTEKSKSMWWPPKDKMDMSAVKFEKNDAS